MEDSREEFLLRKAAEGHKARLLLEALEEYGKSWNRNILATLIKVKTPEEAFRVACAHQAAADFFGGLRAKAATGESATMELKKEGE
jgi:hypothetical protein